MTTVVFRLKALDGSPIRFAKFRIEAGYPDSVVDPSIQIPAPVEFVTDTNGTATISIPGSTNPFFLTKANGSSDELIAFKFFVPDVDHEVEAEMLYVDLGSHMKLKNDASIYALIEAKVSVLHAAKIVTSYTEAMLEAVNGDNSVLRQLIDTNTLTLTSLINSKVQTGPLAPSATRAPNADAVIAAIEAAMEGAGPGGGGGTVDLTEVNNRILTAETRITNAEASVIDLDTRVTDVTESSENLYTAVSEIFNRVADLEDGTGGGTGTVTSVNYITPGVDGNVDLNLTLLGVNPISGGVVDVNRQNNIAFLSTPTLTITWSEAPAGGQSWGLVLKNETASPVTVTIPSCYSVAKQTSITSFVVPANQVIPVGFVVADGGATLIAGEAGGVNNLAASADPTVNDDSTQGYEVGSLIVNGTKVFFATSVAPGAANWVWLNEPAGSGGTVSDGDKGDVVVTSGSWAVKPEVIDDRVSSLLQAGTNITLSYNDAGNALTINASGTGAVADGSITMAKLADIGTATVIGRTAAGTGVPSAISLSSLPVSTAQAAADTSLVLNAQTGTTYTLVLSDAGKQIDIANAAANTVTIPTNATVAFSVGTVITVCMAGTGATTIAGAGGVTLQKPTARSYTISAQYETAMLHKVGTDLWRVIAG